MTNSIQYSIFVTAKNGDVAEIKGSQAAVDAIEGALAASTLCYWNANVESWDFGFYIPVESALKQIAKRATGGEPQA